MMVIFRVIVSLLVALLVSTFVSRFLAMVIGGVGIFLWPVLLILVFFVTNRLLKGSEAGRKSSIPDGFNVACAHDNIAIDMEARELWIRDRSGRTAVLDKGDILRWKQEYDPGANGCCVNNRIQIYARDLTMHEVAFKRHGDVLVRNARRNTAECEEWMSRLSVWINNT